MLRIFMLLTTPSDTMGIGQSAFTAALLSRSDLWNCAGNTEFSVHKIVEKCFHLGHCAFKTQKYTDLRKDAEAVIRAFHSVKPLFYLSSF